MKKLKSKIFYANLVEWQGAIDIESRLNEFLETLDYNQIEDIKISSSQANSYKSNMVILVTYTEEE